MSEESTHLHKKRIHHKTYPFRLSLIIKDEEYCTETNSIVPTNKRIKLSNIGYDSDCIRETETPRKVYPYIRSSRYDPQEYTFEESWSHSLPIDPYDTVYQQHFTRNHKARLIGDVPYIHTNTIFKTKDEIDKTNNPLTCPRRSTVQQIQENILLENEFYLTREDYNASTRPLPTVPIDYSHPTQQYSFTSHGYHHRLRASVHFTTVTKYYPKDKFCPPSIPITPVKDFFFTDPNNIVIGKTYRTPRSHIDQDKPQSILLQPTLGYERHRYWQERFYQQDQIINQHCENSTSDYESSLTASLLRYKTYSELLKNSNDWLHWFTTTTSNLCTIKQQLKEDSREYHYYLNRKYYHELIDKVAIDKILHTASIRRIIYAWRTWIKRKHILRTATVRKIVKFLRQNTGEPSSSGQV